MQYHVPMYIQEKIKIYVNYIQKQNETVRKNHIKIGLH